MAARNPRLTGFRSLSGGAVLPPGDYPEGCPEARRAGRPTSLAAVYDGPAGPLPPPAARMTAQAERLPFLDWPSLGEGGTPLLGLAAPAGLGALYMKAEWANPTGSHKDRASPLVVARALETARGVACASSGNAGVSLAAYAARAGVPCRVVIAATVPRIVRETLAAYGAEVVEAADSLARWRALEALAREGWSTATNYALPASGSSAWGVEGYRTLAFELAAELPGGIDGVVVPTARGDLLSGIALGFAELRDEGVWRHAGPRLVAVEPFARLSAVLGRGAAAGDLFDGATRQSSIAGPTTTDQAVRAVTSTGGRAVVVDDAAAEAARGRLARAGLLVELAAAAPAAAVEPLLRDGFLAPGARVVLIGTASAARDATLGQPAATERAAA
jgi:threonine synthase